MAEEGPREGRQSGLRYSFRALGHRNFRIFWLSAMTSNIGTWLVNLTIPFILYDITGSALWVGYAAIAQNLPYLLVAPLGGALADRMSRRRLLLITQSSMALVAVTLFACWQGGLREPLLILAFVVATSFINGLNLPTWQAFIHDLVPHEDLRSAIALNSIQLNASRAIGPAIAGLLLATVGAGAAFLVNALSFFAVILALALVAPIAKVIKSAAVARTSMIREIGTAARYAFSHPGLRMSIIVSVLFSLLGNPIYTLTILLADDVYQVDPIGLGFLNAALGVGAIACAPLVAGGSRRFGLSQLVRISLIACGAALLVIGINGNYIVAIVLLVIVGAAGLGIIASAQSSVQLIVADRMRGRVISVRFLLVTALMPVGTQWQSIVAEAFGVQAAMLAAGIGMLIATGVLLALSPRLGLVRMDDPKDTL